VTLDLRGQELSGNNYEDAELTGADVSDAYLRKATFEHADLRFAALRDIQATRVDFDHANLHGADLRGAHLLVAGLGDADLTGARLDGANVFRTAFQRTRLHGASLRGLAELERANVFSIDVGPPGELERRLSHTDREHARAVINRRLWLGGARIAPAHQPRRSDAGGNPAPRRRADRPAGLRPNPAALDPRRRGTSGGRGRAGVPARRRARA
jgi:hypothetical protein